jgi:hypothetical protein
MIDIDYIISARRPFGSRWRKPKKRNKKAWKRIAAGDIWWDKKAIAQASRNAPHLYHDNRRICLVCGKHVLLADDGIALQVHRNQQLEFCSGRELKNI